MTSPDLIPPIAAGPSAITLAIFSRPLASYSARSKSTTSRPTVDVGPCGGAEIPMCDALSSPSIIEMTRRISSGVRVPATRGSYVARTAFQSTPFIFSSKN